MLSDRVGGDFPPLQCPEQATILDKTSATLPIT